MFKKCTALWHEAHFEVKSVTLPFAHVDVEAKKRTTNMDVHLVKTSKFSLTRTWSAQNFANKDVVHLVKTIKI